MLNMPLSDPVVSNTTPLISLAEVGLMDVLASLYSEIWIPQAVYHEYQAGLPHRPFRPSLAQFSWITIHTAIYDPAIPATLDPGETEAIALARAQHARLILIDEHRGRTVAARLGLYVAGSLAVLIEAKKHGFIHLVQPYIDQMIAQGRYIAPSLRQHVLDLSSE